MTKELKYGGFGTGSSSLKVGKHASFFIFDM